MNPVNIPERSEAEWQALREQWEAEARAKVQEWRSKRHEYNPNFADREKGKKK